MRPLLRLEREQETLGSGTGYAALERRAPSIKRAETLPGAASQTAKQASRQTGRQVASLSPSALASSTRKRAREREIESERDREIESESERDRWNRRSRKAAARTAPCEQGVECSSTKRVEHKVRSIERRRRMARVGAKQIERARSAGREWLLRPEQCEYGILQPESVSVSRSLQASVSKKCQSTCVHKIDRLCLALLTSALACRSLARSSWHAKKKKIGDA